MQLRSELPIDLHKNTFSVWALSALRSLLNFEAITLAFVITLYTQGFNQRDECFKYGVQENH